MAGTITALEIQKRNKERVNLYLDGQFALGLSAIEAVRLRLGQYLSDGEIEQLKNEDDRAKAYEQALRFLGYRSRSRAEVEKYLRGKGYPVETIDRTVTRLLDQGYLDDEAFARFWLENREQFRPRSSQFLRYELRQKGIADEIIETVLAHQDETESAWRAVESKMSRWQSLPEPDFKRKVVDFLSRRGFNFETARHVADRAWESIDSREESENNQWTSG